MTEEQKSVILNQYNQIKASYPNHIVFMRLGDFLESFGEDAKKVSETLDLRLFRVRGENMAGFPEAMAEDLIGKLIQEGFTVAVAEKVSGPAFDAFTGGGNFRILE